MKPEPAISDKANDIPNHEGVTSKSSIVWIIVSTLVFSMCVVWLYSTEINHDVAQSISTAERCLDGERLYIDIAEINPPLFIDIAKPPILVARALGTSVISVFYAWIILIVMLCLVISYGVIHHIGILPDKSIRRSLLLAIIFFLFPFSKSDFAQRDFMMIVLFLPYLFLTTGRAMGRNLNFWLALIVGVIGGIGLAFKPYFLLPLIALEGYLTFFRKKGYFWRRIELLAVIVVHLILLWRWITPEYLNMLRVASQVYGAYSISMSNIFLQVIILAPTAYLSLAVFAITRPTTETGELRRVLTICLICLIIIIFIQHKGFTYHLYPSRAIGALLLVIIVLSYANNWSAPSQLFRPSGKVLSYLVAVIVIVQTGFYSYFALKNVANWRSSLVGHLSSFVSQLGKDKPVIILSSSVWPAFPVYNYSGARWVSHFACLWMLPGFYQNVKSSPDGIIYRARNEMDKTEKWQLDTLIEDMIKHKPVLVLVDTSPFKQGFGNTQFDFIQYFIRDPQFATLWQDYQLVGNVSSYSFYRRRNPSQSSERTLKKSNTIRTTKGQ